MSSVQSEDFSHQIIVKNLFLIIKNVIFVRFSLHWYLLLPTPLVTFACCSRVRIKFCTQETDVWTSARYCTFTRPFVIRLISRHARYINHSLSLLIILFIMSMSIVIKFWNSSKYFFFHLYSHSLFQYHGIYIFFFRSPISCID